MFRPRLGLDDKAMARAQKKFAQLDADGSGKLQGEELAALAQWVFASFQPEKDPLLDDAELAQL